MTKTCSFCGKRFTLIVGMGFDSISMFNPDAGSKEEHWFCSECGTTKFVLDIFSDTVLSLRESAVLADCRAKNKPFTRTPADIEAAREAQIREPEQWICTRELFAQDAPTVEELEEQWGMPAINES